MDKQKGDPGPGHLICRTGCPQIIMRKQPQVQIHQVQQRRRGQPRQLPGGIAQLRPRGGKGAVRDYALHLRGQLRLPSGTAHSCAAHGHAVQQNPDTGAEAPGQIAAPGQKIQPVQPAEAYVFPAAFPMGPVIHQQQVFAPAVVKRRTQCHIGIFIAFIAMDADDKAVRLRHGPQQKALQLCAVRPPDSHLFRAMGLQIRLGGLAGLLCPAVQRLQLRQLGLLFCPRQRAPAKQGPEQKKAAQHKAKQQQHQQQAEHNGGPGQVDHAFLDNPWESFYNKVYHILEGNSMEDCALSQLLSRLGPVIRAHFKKNAFSAAPFRPGKVQAAGDFSVLRLPGGDADTLEAAITASNAKPDLVEIEGLGVFAIGRCKAEADAILDAAVDGKSYSPADARHFEEGRMQGRVILVTGAAQGFGEGLAKALARHGAHILVTDIQLEKAQGVADGLCALYGPGAAAAAYCDVTQEASVEAAFGEAARIYGGVDAAISNAGVAFSGTLETMDEKRFDFLMSVNVKGYYLVSKYAARQMRLETKYDPNGYYRDIVQINSISGLGGYVNNFTYGASKFAGIGMTQCLALELVKQRIKVNAVCPGNFYDGPLWSDPDKGLFKLYFEDGKMPGCKNVQEAEQYYRAKDPFGRGCVPEDVACSVLYCIEQQYDSGQAVSASGALRMVK